MSMIEAKGITKVYKSTTIEVRALKGIDLTIKKGDFVAIAGASGSGKTTLLNLIGCIDNPSEGRLLLDGDDITRMNDCERTELRRKKIGFIFQTFNLMQALTVYENVEFPLLFTEIMAKQRRGRVLSMLEELGLASVGSHRVTDISGGQQQRCAIGRALIKDPILVLADEPTGNLDSETGKKILELMRQLNKSRSVTFLFSTHDPAIMAYADRVYQLQDGVIV